MRRFFTLAFQAIPWLLLPITLAPLAAWAWLGVFTRYLADDYSTSSKLLEVGFWPAQAFWYEHWSGRYSYTFLIALVELIGVKIVPFIPALALCAWFFSLFWALKQIFSALTIPVEKKWIATLSGVIIFGTVRSLTGYTEVIFWQTGILTYQITNIFLAFFLAVFLKRFFSPDTKPVKGWEYLLALVIALAIGGFSETGIGIQLALLTLALLYFAFLYKNNKQKDILSILLAAYAGSWCSFFAILKAPGNLGRTTRMTGLSLESLSTALVASVKDTPVFLAEWFKNNTSLALVVFFTGLVLGFLMLRPGEAETRPPRTHLLLGFALFGVGCTMIAAGFFPAYAIWGARPPDRAIFIPMFLFAWSFALLGFFVGHFCNAQLKSANIRSPLLAVLLLTLALTMLWVQARAAYASVQLLPTLQTYARLWDERDAFLRQAHEQKKMDVTIPSVRRNPALHDIRDTIWNIGELVEDKKNWINVAASSYYGLRSIAGK